VDADPAELVRSGYNAVSRAYRSDDDPAHEYGPWLASLLERIPGRGQVLDIGCGCGVPVARRLAAAGHQVTGVDVSDVQVERARKLVPGAVFLRADATDLDFPPGSFDAATYRTWLTQAGLEVTSQQFVPEGNGGHALFWAQARHTGTPHAGAAGGR
jgi:SAM-dependent methyltransferase